MNPGVSVRLTLRITCGRDCAQLAQHLLMRCSTLSHSVYAYFQPTRTLVHRKKKNTKRQMVHSLCLTINLRTLTSLTSLTLPLSPPRLNVGYRGTGPA